MTHRSAKHHSPLCLRRAFERMSDNKHVPPMRTCVSENKERRENTGCDYDPGSTTGREISGRLQPLAVTFSSQWGKRRGHGGGFCLVKTKHPWFVHTMRMRGLKSLMISVVICNLRPLSATASVTVPCLYSSVF